MAQITLDQAISARRSARARSRTLRRCAHRSWGKRTWNSSPLSEPQVFNDEIRRIEEIYRGITDRIDHALENVKVEI